MNGVIIIIDEYLLGVYFILDIVFGDVVGNKLNFFGIIFMEGESLVGEIY